MNKTEAMSGRQHATSTDSDKSEAYQNAVDFILAKFPPDPIQETQETESIAVQVDDPIQVKNEPEDNAAFPDVYNTNQPKEANGSTNAELRFDSSFSTTYGFTELDVSF